MFFGAGLFFQDTPVLAKNCPETNLLLDTYPDYTTTYPMVLIFVLINLIRFIEEMVWPTV
jgi:hypothetical protein